MGLPWPASHPEGCMLRFVCDWHLTEIYVIIELLDDITICVIASMKDEHETILEVLCRTYMFV